MKNIHIFNRLTLVALLAFGSSFSAVADQSKVSPIVTQVIVKKEEEPKVDRDAEKFAGLAKIRKENFKSKIYSYGKIASVVTAIVAGVKASDADWELFTKGSKKSLKTLRLAPVVLAAGVGSYFALSYASDVQDDKYKSLVVRYRKEFPNAGSREEVEIRRELGIDSAKK